MKRLISMLVIFSMMLTSVSVSAFADNATSVTADDIENTVYGETVYRCKLRCEPSKDADAICEIPAGELLYMVGSVVNSWDHVWYEINYFGNKVYCYSENVVEHTHVYDIPVEDSENSNVDCYICACGNIDCSYSGTTNTFLPMVGIAIGAEEVTTALAFVGAYYGTRIVGKHLIPVMVNKAGSLVSITSDQLRKAISQAEDDNGSSDGEKVYFPATVLIGNRNDSVELFNLSSPMDIDEACDYLDCRVLAAKGAFRGGFGSFAKKVNFCNIYTYDITHAEALCRKLVSCQKNSLNKYGSHRLTGVFEINCAEKLDGTYKHFHVFNNYDEAANCHIFFGDAMTNITKFPDITN